jgi:hypothetical protein
MVEDHLLQGNWAPLWDALVSEGIPENRRTANAQLGERVPRLVSLLVHLASNLTSAYFTFYRRLGPCETSYKALQQWNASIELKKLKRLCLAECYRDGEFLLDDAICILPATPNIEIL